MFCCTIKTFKCFINVGVLKNVACFDNVLISFFLNPIRKKVTLFDMACKRFGYYSAVRGFHYCKKYWQPIEGQTLDCMREKDNTFNFFAINIILQNSGRTMGHLPVENS